MLIGTLSVFMNYAQGMMEPVQWLVQVISSLVNVQVNVERFTKLMETESDVRDTPEVTEKYGDAFHPKKENWGAALRRYRVPGRHLPLPRRQRERAGALQPQGPAGHERRHRRRDRRGQIHAREPRLPLL